MEAATSSLGATQRTATNPKYLIEHSPQLGHRPKQTAIRMYGRSGIQNGSIPDLSIPQRRHRLFNPFFVQLPLHDHRTYAVKGDKLEHSQSSHRSCHRSALYADAIGHELIQMQRRWLLTDGQWIYGASRRHDWDEPESCSRQQQTNATASSTTAQRPTHLE